LLLFNAFALSENVCGFGVLLQRRFSFSKKVFSLTQVGLWIFGAKLGVDAVTAAILGLSVLLVTGVVTWKECLAESVAWDTLTWFAALIAMAGYLNKYGLIEWFSQTVVKVC